MLSAALAPGGELVLSGILEDQATEVADAYRVALPQVDIEVDDGWVRLQGRKPIAPHSNSDTGPGQV
jgi:ribosomal protein L11 methyltransferase